MGPMLSTLTWFAIWQFTASALLFLGFWAGLIALVWYAERRAQARPSISETGPRPARRPQRAGHETAPAIPFARYLAGFPSWCRRNPAGWPVLYLKWRVSLRHGPD